MPGSPALTLHRDDRLVVAVSFVGVVLGYSLVQPGRLAMITIFDVHPHPEMDVEAKPSSPLYSWGS